MEVHVGGLKGDRGEGQVEGGSLNLKARIHLLFNGTPFLFQEAVLHPPCIGAKLFVLFIFLQKLDFWKLSDHAVIGDLIPRKA